MTTDLAELSTLCARPMPADQWCAVRVRTQAEADANIQVSISLRDGKRQILDMTPTEMIDLRGRLGHWVHLVVVRGLDTPLHPDWVRSIRDQCAEAGVEFVFCSWGEWMPWRMEHTSKDQTQECVDLTRLHISGQFPAVSPESFESYEAKTDWLFRQCCNMVRVGSALSGRTLDGREWL